MSVDIDPDRSERILCIGLGTPVMLGRRRAADGCTHARTADRMTVFAD
jgi:hypothetical protein